MKNVTNKIKRIKAEDGKVWLPKFKKLDDGSFEVEGSVEVSKMSEIREYLKEYREIAGLIREHYKREISELFCHALGELVGRADYFLDGIGSQRVPMEDLGEEFNDVEYYSRIVPEKSIPERTIERILASDGLDVKRYRPGKGIIELMRASNETGYMVLPEMSDYGVVAVPDDNSKAVSIRFKKFNEQDALAIKRYLLSVADSVEGGDVCKRKIEKMFETSNALAGVDTSYSPNEMLLFSKLGQQSVDLMGIDLSAFRKKPRAKAVKKTDDSHHEELAGSGLENGADYEQHIEYDKQGNGVDTSTGKITKIVVEGLNNLSQGINNGQIQVVLSPTEGFVYTIKINGEELVASQTTAEPVKE